MGLPSLPCVSKDSKEGRVPPLHVRGIPITMCNYSRPVKKYVIHKTTYFAAFANNCYIDLYFCRKIFILSKKEKATK